MNIDSCAFCKSFPILFTSKNFAIISILNEIEIFDERNVYEMLFEIKKASIANPEYWTETCRIAFEDYKKLSIKSKEFMKNNIKSIINLIKNSK